MVQQPANANKGRTKHHLLLHRATFVRRVMVDIYRRLGRKVGSVENMEIKAAGGGW